MAAALNKPFIGVNHIEGHIYGNLLSQKNYEFPIIFLIVSGGHTQIVLMEDDLKYKILGKTRDDAVGEAFDKGAKMLGLPYPGGPEIDSLAQKGDPNYYKFPRAWLKDDSLDFSYSGLKTALLTFLKDKNEKEIQLNLNNICASYQAAAVDVLVQKTITAAEKFKSKRIAIAGGVAANSLLRSRLEDECSIKGFEFYLPEFKYCTDNAAMIARAGYEYINRKIYSDQNLNAYPALKLDSL
jgi:N6-L-threonylcarbamoyladenine synthase